MELIATGVAYLGNLKKGLDKFIEDKSIYG